MWGVFFIFENLDYYAYSHKFKLYAYWSFMHAYGVYASVAPMPRPWLGLPGHMKPFLFPL